MANITGQVTLNQLSLIEVDAAPGGGAGTAAPIGSFAYYNNGSIGVCYVKTGSANTSWNIVSSQTAAVAVGLITFGDANGYMSGDSNLFWDNTAKSLGVGRTPAAGNKLDVNGTVNINVSGSSSTLNIGANNSTTNPALIVFTGTASVGDFRITGDGGDIYWQGGGGRTLQMGAYHEIILIGGRNTISAPAYLAGNGATYNTRVINSSTSSIGLTVEASTGQTGDLQRWIVNGVTLAQVLSSGLLNAANAIRLGSTTDTTNGNVRFGSNLDIEFYRDTWRNLSYPKHVFDDFFWTAVATSQPLAWASTVANGGANTFNGTTANSYSGIIQLATGTTANATGVAALQSGNGTNSIVLGALPVSVEWRVQLPTVNTTPFYEFRVGLQDTATAGDPANGVYFSYIDSASASAWQCVTRNASTSSTTSSGVNVVGGTWFRLRMEINAAANSVAFYIKTTGDYTLVATNTLNITTNPLRLVAKINKITNSNTSRTALLDYVFINVER